MRLAHRRKSLRLPDYDYSHQGAYFVTICVKDKMPLFGKIVNGEMVNNENGKLVLDTWNKLPAHYPHIALDAFMVMPNHVHGILMIVEENDQPVGARV